MRRVAIGLLLVLSGTATSLGQLTISATAPAPGGLVYSVANIPPGTTAGRTYVSFNTSLAAGAGALLGLNLDFFDFLGQAATPIQPGNPLAWSYPSGMGSFPDAPFTLPAGSLPNGLQFDLMAMATGFGPLVAFSNVVRYAAGPSISTTSIVEETPFNLSFPAVSNNPLDFCTLIMDPTGNFERVILTPNPTGGWMARVPRGAVPPTGPGTLMIAEGQGAMLPQTATGPMTLTTQSWVGTQPANQSIPGITTAGTGSLGGSPCTLTNCVTYWSKAVIVPGSGMTQANWQVTVPAGALACLCLPTTQVLFDLHGDILTPGGTSASLHFDKFIYGTNSTSMDPCQCLAQVMLQFSTAVAAQTAGKVICLSSCVLNAAGDYVVTVNFIAFGGSSFISGPSGKLRICP
jgi:hypothetical protein